MSTPRKTTGSLGALLQGMARVEAADERSVSGLSLDSRRVRRGDLFMACPGHRRHGHAFIAEAVAKGAAAVVFDSGIVGDDLTGARVVAGARSVPMVAVAELNQRVGEIAARFYGRPSETLTVVGITGTNGKTSCSHFIAQTLTRAGVPCGVIGTLGYGPYGRLAPAPLTTPDAVTIQSLMADLRAVGCRHVVLEASSHGLLQGRLNGVAFDAALFTNLTRDHLDYHRAMEDYGAAKARLFRSPGLRYAVINGDDPFGRALLLGLPVDVDAFVYCLTEDAQPTGEAFGDAAVIRGSRLQLDRRGLTMAVHTPWGTGVLSAPLIGRFNALNLLGVLAVLLALGLSLDTALERLAGVETVPGRMEAFGARRGQPLVVVDYAHTPDALQQVLTALRGHTAGALWCVFGCGGDRDPGKRPQMGAIAEACADRVVVTDDNPRGEQSSLIIDGILRGLRAPDRAQVIADRAAAIAYAIGHAAEGDVVLVAGKGHEEYQIVGTEQRPFSDRQQVRAVLKEVA
jgi:UDP-N-acetylmuramoyl-L-alanyl-D-glutamate--2,6-diaminopimelate ligase